MARKRKDEMLREEFLMRAEKPLKDDTPSNEHNEENFDDDFLIEMTDEEGNVYYYVEEMIIPVGEENFALLVEVKDEHEHGAGCDCGCEDDDIIIAKIVLNEDGQEEYVEPTDEEFELVQAAYEQLLLDEEE